MAAPATRETPEPGPPAHGPSLGPAPETAAAAPAAPTAPRAAPLPADTPLEGRFYEARASVDGIAVSSTGELHALLERTGPYDLVVGINTKDVETTILHVMNVVCEGLQEHFHGLRTLVLVSDGTSRDSTRQLAEFYPAPNGVRKLVLQQLGGPGKGNGVRTVFEVARMANARACAIVDGDLVSIRPGWVDNLLQPIVYGLADVVIPYYLRDKWDGVITNHLCYPLTAALYGTSVRQPIGGDYGFSRRAYTRFLEDPSMPEDFGIDIYLATTAIAEGLRMQEAPLGIKIHTSTIGYTDPRATLSRMYLEVVGELLDLAVRYEQRWREHRPTPPVLLSENPLPYYDRLPPPTRVDEDNVRSVFVEGLEHHAAVLGAALPPDLIRGLESSRESGVPGELWARVVYGLAAHHITADGGDARREELLHALGALGMGRFLHFVRETRDMDLREAYALIRDQAGLFQRMLPEFTARVDALRRERAEGTGSPAGNGARREVRGRNGSTPKAQAPSAANLPPEARVGRGAA